ncbi:MAG: deoxyribonuclease I [Marinobacter excellens HL-55]|uniref:Deoxyribonuclease I n=1 Tax=Marinobacter excellens HL-55 TaxID=1305731 RepID=A0A0P8B3M9_9GAMM|nr:MAG: deoxyribonuclease I [Marinobacter excellens HL-55]
MKTILSVPITLTLVLSTSLVIGQNGRFTDPDTVVRDQFWGDLYAAGGNSYFCDEPFSNKGFVMTDGYVYPLADIRSALNCGTSRECLQNNQYRQITSDLHNIVPVRTRVEMRRRSVRYENLAASARVDDCGIRESAQFFEPPERVKGDVARTMAYMVDSYGLPWLGATSVFQGWNELDPPDDQELSRHSRIAEIQGNENPFVVNPGLVNRL